MLRTSVNQLFIFAGLFFLVSCSFRPDIFIQNDRGVPLAKAEVRPHSLSMQYDIQFSDDKGHVYLSMKPQKIEWIEVSKEGYENSGLIPFEGALPITIKLKKIEP